jgi:hypothetical protein
MEAKQSLIKSVYCALHVPAFRPTRAGLWVLHAASNIETLLLDCVLPCQ